MSAPTTLVSAVPVPFDANGDLDVNGQKTLLRHLKDAGIGGVFIAGTTGEFTALDDDERAVVLSAALEVYGADAVYMHVGAAAARQAERLTAQAVALGATALGGDHAVLPARRSSGIDRLLPPVGRRRRRRPDLCLPVRRPHRQHRHPGSTRRTGDRFRRSPGRRSAASRNPLVLQYVRAVPDDFEVYSGNDIEFGDFVRAGGTGAVSGVSSVFPRPFLDLADALQRSDDQAAAAAQERVKQAVDAAQRGRHRAASRRACRFKAYRQVRPGWPSTSQLPRSWKPCAPQSRT